MPVWMPMFPHMPRPPHHPAHSGYGTGVPGAIPDGPGFWPADSLQGRLAAHGIPLSFTGTGLPVLYGGAHGPTMGMPPQIPGMPVMPEPPPDFLGGGFSSVPPT